MCCVALCRGGAGQAGGEKSNAIMQEENFRLDNDSAKCHQRLERQCVYGSFYMSIVGELRRITQAGLRQCLTIRSI